MPSTAKCSITEAETVALAEGNYEEASIAINLLGVILGFIFCFLK